jgi:flagellin
VAKTTSFNGKKLLDGSFAGAVFQVGANSGDNITVGGLGNTTAAGLSNVNYAELVKEDIDVSTKATFGAVAADDGAAAPTATWTIKVGTDAEISLGALDKASSNEERLGQVVAAINAKTADTGVTAFLEKQTDGKYALNLKSERVDVDATTGEVTAQAVVFTGLDKVFVGVQADGTTEQDLGGLKAAPTGLDIAGDDTTLGKNGKGIDAIDITTQANAWVSLKKIDDAMDQVNSVRGQLGALQTRFEKTVENIDIMSENVTAARGRIVDADFAKETANLSRAQILQQAGTAMVAQANQLPQSVLSLLK